MKSILGNFVLLLLLVLPATVLIFNDGQSGSIAVHADDPVEGEDEDIEDDGEATVETDDGTADEEGAVTETEQETEKTEEDEEEEAEQIKPSPNADAIILFTKPTSMSSDLPAGHIVRFLVGFVNKGEKDFTVETMDVSFRYPQDYSFFIQNFTQGVYNQVVEPNREASFEYGFTPPESFQSRPFGLTVLLNYKDADGAVFQSAVFNETINVVEPDEGLDGETFFMYVFLAAVLVLLLVGAQQLLTRFGKKRLLKPRQQKIEMGTQNSDVDYSWIPQETLRQEMNKSPKSSPKQSPRKRRSKRTTGSGEE